MWQNKRLGHYNLSAPLKRDNFLKMSLDLCFLLWGFWIGAEQRISFPCRQTLMLSSDTRVGTWQQPNTVNKKRCTTHQKYPQKILVKNDPKKGLIFRSDNHNFFFWILVTKIFLVRKLKFIYFCKRILFWRIFQHCRTYLDAGNYD